MAHNREILSSFPLVEVTDIAAIAIQQIEKHGLFGITRISFINSNGEAVLFVRAFSYFDLPPTIDLLPAIKEEIQ